MNAYRKILTRGDPLGAIRTFLLAIWQQSNLDGMLVPVNDIPEKLNRLRYIADPRRLDEVNPFKPVMIENAAINIPSLLERYPKHKLGVILRPCEMRAVSEMSKLGAISLDRLLTISIDCLKTVPIEDYNWRSKRKPASDALTQEVLQFARQGGIAAYRYRSACQMCLSPQALDADINISVIGLPVRKQLLIRIPDDATAQRLNLEVITDGSANLDLIAQHEKVVSKMVNYHNHTMHQITQGLDSVLPKDIDTFISQLEDCAPCEVCMDVCPICSVQRPQKAADGHFVRDEIIRWLIACAGCGMCEQACLSHFPLSAIFRTMREELN
jgi:formate dehydrogenase (coenzyme F420) beta subunit